jgi:hypothetical protein
MDFKQSLIITKIETGQSNIKYAIDLPKSGSPCDASNLYIGFCGWIYSLDGAPVSFVFSHMPEANFSPNRDRPDVQALFQGAPLKCGARYPIDYQGSFKIGANCGGKIYWLAEANLSNSNAKVIVGGQGHLFLANDTNESINQFIGKTLIPDDVIGKWGTYFDALNSWSLRSLKPFTFMVAPAKEYIYPEHYHEKKASITPIEQFSVHFSKMANLLNPEAELVKDKEFAYFKTDSHWNDYGASLAAAAFCRRAGFVYEPPNVEYVVKQFAGDLGSKLTPPKTESALLVSDIHRLIKHKVFDNSVANRGNIAVYENPNAANKKTIMIFGDSFSVFLANSLSHSFSRVVRIISGADIDWCAVDSERPDHLLIELTSRFLIRAPSSGFSISNEIKKKYSLMDASTLQNLAQILKSHPTSKGNFHLAACREAMSGLAPEIQQENQLEL